MMVLSMVIRKKINPTKMTRKVNQIVLGYAPDVTDGGLIEIADGAAFCESSDCVSRSQLLWDADSFFALSGAVSPKSVGTLVSLKSNVDKYWTTVVCGLRDLFIEAISK